jgi:hypothetical protein
MNHDRVHDLLSKASEAIVSEDGRVQRRINNYETVIGNDAEDPFYIPTGAVNDNYGNLNNYVMIAGRRVAKVTLLRYAMYSTVIVVVLVFSWSLLTLLMPSSTKSFIHNEATDAVTMEERASSELQLERIANLIIRDGEWNDTRIKLFLREWGKNTPSTREEFKTTAWYQHFSFRLKNKFHQEREIGAFADQDNLASTHSIMQLALALGIADPNINYAAVGRDSKQIDELAEEVTQELARLEETKLAGQQAAANKASVDYGASMNKYLKEELGVASAPTDVQSPPGVAKPVSVVKQSEVIAATEPSISASDIDRVINKYVSAYELGDIQQMTALFGVDNPAQGNKILEQLKKNYELVFANSQKRSVSFQGINWRIQGPMAIVSSDYQANIELKDNKGVQSVEARARVELQLMNNELKIGHLELLDRQINVITPELRLASTSNNNNKPKRPDAPTAAELQDIVTRLVGAYESGNIKTLTSLFAKDAKTNDRDGIKGIAEDYTQLFASTSERQMFIQGMEWSQDRNYAKGSGDLEATVFAQGGQSVYTMKGKIQIVAKRIDDKVLITHMYHIERPD